MRPAAADRPDPVDLLERQAESRIAELVPIRYGRMLVSPFAFYRGAAAIMASDLAALPRTRLKAQLCGDAHGSNFGVFASPDRRLVFDINDFDETSPGPWEWDVKRLVASLAVSGRENSFKPKERHRVVRDTAASYRRAMRSFAGMRDLQVWYARQEVDALLAELRPALTRQPPVIEKYTGVLAAADVFTEDVTFEVMQSIRLDLGYGAQVHP